MPLRRCPWGGARGAVPLKRCPWGGALGTVALWRCPWGGALGAVLLERCSQGGTPGRCPPGGAVLQRDAPGAVPQGRWGGVLLFVSSDLEYACNVLGLQHFNSPEPCCCCAANETDRPGNVSERSKEN